MNTKIKFDFKQTKVTVTTAEFLLGIYNPVEENEDSTELIGATKIVQTILPFNIQSLHAFTLHLSI